MKRIANVAGEHIMGKTLSHDDKAGQYCSISDLSKRETANYIHDMLGSLQEIALDKNMSMLARLITVAKAEAKNHM
jgi:hypothetical protein